MIFSAHMQSTKLILFLAIVSDNSNFILCDFFTLIFTHCLTINSTMLLKIYYVLG